MSDTTPKAVESEPRPCVGCGLLTFGLSLDTNRPLCLMCGGYEKHGNVCPACMGRDTDPGDARRWRDDVGRLLCVECWRVWKGEEGV